MCLMHSPPHPRAARIEACLRQRFAPSLLRITDDSGRHAGHAGARALAQAGVEGETHFSVAMVSEAFHGESRLARSRAVHAALDDEFRTGLHALALTLRTPEEQAAETSA